MKNTIMNTVTIKEFLKSMKIAHKAGNAQILFGLPGIGKTELILSEGLKILSTESFKFTDEYKDYLLSAPYSAEKIESIVDGMRKPKFSRSEIIQEIKLMTEERSVHQSVGIEVSSDEEFKAEILAKQEEMSKPSHTEEEIALFLETDVNVKPRFTKAEVAKMEKELYKQAQFHMDMSGQPEESMVMPWLDNNAEDGQRLKLDLTVQLKELKRFLDITKEGKCRFFIDELTSASQDDQRTLMNFIQGGLLPDGSKIDLDRVVFVLAGNPSADMPGYQDYDGATNPVENAVITRGGVYFLETTVYEFLEWGKELSSTHPGQPNIHPYLISALEVDPNLYMNDEKDDIRILNSRTAFKLSEYLYAASEMNERWETYDLAAYVGDKTASVLGSIMAKLDKLVGITQLFGSDKSNKLVPEAFDKFVKLQEFEKYYVIATAVSDNSKVSFKTKNNVIKLHKLLKDGDIAPEVFLSLTHLFVEAHKKAKKSNAAAILSAKWMSDEETDIQQLLRESLRAANLINATR